ncbi:MFS transporter [Loigolactobacillus zhaoyuanensis]|uniref:MFS transporter n=1 Tax=Loigolactobacillus zhaoyuanensis TaxID=2486017 RepID=UPI000F74483B|nr:MFS transporter [Loigolactobacillus zhaoyuanensis]
MNTVNKKQVISIIGLFSFLSSLSGSSVNLALPKISIALGIFNSASTWVLQTGLITTAVLLVFFGHLGDLISKNLVFIYGGAFFIVGSAINGLAPNFVILIVGRIIQAIGSAMIMANTMGIITETFPDKQRAEALAINSMFISVGAISGPAIGGLIMGLTSWRGIFLINIPVGLVILWLGFIVLPRPKKSVHSLLQIVSQVNWLGQFLFTFGIIILFLSSNLFQKGATYLLVGTGILLFGVGLTIYAFVQDDHARQPWIAPELLHNPTYMLSVTTLFLAMMVNVFSNVLLPFYLQSFLGLGALKSGLIMGAQALVMLGVSPLVGYFADRWNRITIILVGLLLLLVSQIGYVVYPLSFNWLRILGPIVLNGIGMGMFISPNNALTMGVINPKFAGVGGSFSSFARTLGMSLGVSLASTLLFLQLSGVRQITPVLGGNFMQAFHRVFLVAALISIVTILLMLYRALQTEHTKKD